MKAKLLLSIVLLGVITISCQKDLFLNPEKMVSEDPIVTVPDTVTQADPIIDPDGTMVSDPIIDSEGECASASKTLTVDTWLNPVGSTKYYQFAANTKVTVTDLITMKVISGVLVATTTVFDVGGNVNRTFYGSRKYTTNFTTGINGIARVKSGYPTSFTGTVTACNTCPNSFAGTYLTTFDATGKVVSGTLATWIGFNLRASGDNTRVIVVSGLTVFSTIYPGAFVSSTLVKNTSFRTNGGTVPVTFAANSPIKIVDGKGTVLSGKLTEAVWFYINSAKSSTMCTKPNTVATFGANGTIVSGYLNQAQTFTRASDGKPVLYAAGTFVKFNTLGQVI